MEESRYAPRAKIHIKLILTLILTKGRTILGLPRSKKSNETSIPDAQRYVVLEDQSRRIIGVGQPSCFIGTSKDAAHWAMLHIANLSLDGGSTV